MIGKLVGGLFGWALGGALGMPLLGIIGGIWLGNRFDRSLRMIMRNFSSHGFQFNAYTHYSPAQQVFFEVTFEVMGHLAKADGRVSESEIAMANRVMQQFGIRGDQRQLAVEAFTRGKQSKFSLDQALNRLLQASGGQPQLLMIFLDIQAQAASVDGSPSRKQQAVLDRIRQAFGLSGFDQSYGFGGSYQQRAGAGQRRASSGHNLSKQEAYKILGVSANASQAEIKKAYRKRMGENHPDRLIAKGLPEEMIKAANQKVQQIKAAYELLKET